MISTATELELVRCVLIMYHGVSGDNAGAAISSVSITTDTILKAFPALHTLPSEGLFTLGVSDSNSISGHC